MKKNVLVFLVIITCMIITASCGNNNSSSNDDLQSPALTGDVQNADQEKADKALDEPEDSMQIQTKSFGTYTIASGWSESSKLSSGEKYFYLKDGISDTSATSNISVEMGTNRYPESEHESFREAILEQLLMQTSQASTSSTVLGNGTNTENGYILYIFTIEEESQNITTKQYYIVGDNKYILIQETDFHNKDIQDISEVALAIVNSFEWTK